MYIDTPNRFGWVAVVLFVCEARRDGNIPQSACSNMQPGHPGEIQASASPYGILLESVFFITGQSLRVYLEKSSDSAPPFIGFYCQGRKENSPNEIAGYFTDLEDGVRGHNCFQQAPEPNTVSHNAEWSRGPKPLLVLSWQTSDIAVERVRFRCTFVQNYTTYWTLQESSVARSLKTESFNECCEAEGVAIGCRRLCRHITQEPESTSLAREVLENASENATQCNFFDAQRSLRCTYWSAPANRLDDASLNECCQEKNITDECMGFCEKEIFATMNYYEDDLKACFNRHPDLSLCIIYPAEGEDAMGTVATETFPSSTKISTSTGPRMVATETSFSTTEITTTSRAKMVVTETSPSTTRISTSAETSAPIALTSQATFSTTPFTTSQETTIAISTSLPQPTTTPTDSTLSPEEPGILVFYITCTVDVTGAMEDEDLRLMVFSALETSLLIPGLSTVTGYSDVSVGVQYFEGSLVVMSEGRFAQQSNGYVPLISEVQNALSFRLGEINNQINDGSQTWSVDGTVTVSRKEINGICSTPDCEIRERCVEIGWNESVCLCLDSSNAEVHCGPGTSSGLSDGAIAGIVASSLLILLALIVVLVCAYRGVFSDCPPSKTAETAPKQRHTSALSNESYVYPESGLREEPLYMDISSDRPPLPPLPPNASATLPSHSMTYDVAIVSEDKIQELRENEEGYMEPLSPGKGSGKPTDVGNKAVGGNDYTEPYVVQATVAEDVTTSENGKSQVCRDADAQNLTVSDSTNKQTRETDRKIDAAEYIALDSCVSASSVPSVGLGPTDNQHEESSFKT